MIVRLVCVGAPRPPLRDPIEEFERRARHYWKLEIVEVPGGAPGRPDAERVRTVEGERMAPRLPPTGRIVALTRDGSAWSSERLASFLEEEALASTPSVNFLIGGAFGIAPGLLARADRRLSLSALTLPHEVARLLLAEQLYRAGTIRRGEPYHKGTGSAGSAVSRFPTIGEDAP